ncbi:ATP synthase F1 subunit epsilon [Helicobacter sp. MIT 21-1697]|uniref:ATP synthase F1 subunit epsilon n=1 Tax=Helicobacter sp. MIT 21-1697 TaxID=2993733 RepID=UPI00224AA7F6|nr:ATP synthase F1 subunit epsilon [Helicobacter sp. MIT 21-1697]MCX2716420.1 ATP synthase F1 subunit epsilon [Helicobacter sp. MIT 21-1697]
MESLTLSIVTPYGSIYNGTVKHVIMPGSEGEFGVFPGHCNLLSLLKVGVIEFESLEGDKGLIAINWGHAQISNADVKIIADGAVAIAGNTESEIALAIDDAKTLLKEASDDDALFGMVVSRVESGYKKFIE